MLTHLVLALSMLASPPSEAAAQAAFNAKDYEKALELYLERAADPDVHRPDAVYGAHDSLIALHGQTGDPAQLCRALALARELLAQGPFADTDERGSWEEIEARDVEEIERAGITCPASPTPAPPVDDQRAEQPRTTPPSVRVEKLPAPRPGPKDSPPRWRPRGQVAAAAVLGAVGVGLLSWMGGALVGRARAKHEIAAITAAAMAVDRDVTAAERAAAYEANDRYRRLDGTAKAVGIAGGVILLTSLAVLLIPPRQGPRTRLRASNAGFVYSF
ncbi:hypothetical protein OV203_05445 [Nannocystis sp. ILAH1]|uniref:hypothetical protein n=1 Tax=Nannocystis sp. ILAH1 TaxID=2996789 RepID=UPI00226D4C84|nr:hypothetical protein [Nannocystis sp. ILAH1]MCY0986552.1 hypothetical protein [Nannocystis sp. ILAH1]